MALRLVLTEAPDPAKGLKDVGENILFNNLPSDYKVYAFYYPGEPPDKALENALRGFGEKSGKNLMLVLGSLKDPQLDKIVKRFSVETYPVIVVTALADLASPKADPASPGKDYVTTYARLDSKYLLQSPQRTVECLQKLFNLFLQGEVAKAISQAKWSQRAELASSLTHWIGDALKSLGGFIANRDISISLTEGKLELKR